MHRLISGCLMIALTALASPAQTIGFDDFGAPIKTDSYVSLTSVPQGATAHLAIEITMNVPWHINAHDLGESFFVPTEVSFDPPEGVTIDEVVYPAGVEKELAFTEEKLLLYDGTVYIGATFTVAPDVPVGRLTIPATVTYQACDDEKCLLPADEKLFVQVEVSSPRASIDAAHPEIFAGIAFAGAGGGGEGSGAGGLARTVATKGLFWGFVLVFLGGLALNLTPCIYPMIPITVSYFGGQARGRPGRTVLLAVLYTLGMATMYSTLGLVAALTGSILGSALQNVFVLAFVATVMVGLAMSMFGFYEIRVPARLAGVAGTAKQGVLGSFLMGATVGIVAAPCIGPFVLGLLTFVGEMGDPVIGFWLFFVLALGLGTPFAVLAYASGNIARLPKSGEWMEWVRKLFGVILLGMAVFFLRPLLGDPLYYGLLGAVCVIGGIVMGFILRVTSSLIFFNALRRFVGVAAPLYGLYLILTPGNIIAHDAHAGIAWVPYDDDHLVAAQTESKPVVIDFTADWCLPCKELEHETFNQPEVVTAAKPFVTLRADLTRSASDEVRDLREKYKIRGVPTIVFIGADGRERTDLRVIEFVEKDEFLELLHKLGS